MRHYAKKIDSPVGELTLIANSRALIAILWEKDDPNRVRIDEVADRPEHPVLLRAEKQLSEYFEGKRTHFSIDFEFYGTGFQKKVWTALRQIPYGQTRSYRDIAKQIGAPKAYRAVGTANGKNPISVIIPCHRVIGSNGKLTGFAGGLGTKQFLLELESSGLSK